MWVNMASLSLGGRNTTSHTGNTSVNLFPSSPEEQEYRLQRTNTMIFHFTAHFLCAWYVLGLIDLSSQQTVVYAPLFLPP